MLAVLNAGMGVHGRFDEVDLDTQLRPIDLDVRSTLHLATLLTRAWSCARRGWTAARVLHRGQGTRPGLRRTTTGDGEARRR